ncbi:MAG: phosphatase PAP2 family protein [Sphingobacteriales bacterium]|nr:MAG: phosphatase PAP2 family protein [Sphingobacteriales bacterium]
MQRVYSFCAALLLSFNCFAQTEAQPSINLIAAVPVENISLALPEESAKTGLPKEEVYKLKPKVDIPVTAVGTAWSLYAFTKIYSKDDSPVEDIRALDKNNINGFDRWAAGKSSDKADAQSNILFYGVMPLPIVFLADKKIRQDFGKVSFLYLEAMSITGLLYTGSTYFVDRYRPETYNTNIPAEYRTSGNLRNAFFAGHVALVATSSFFAAQVYNDYHPDSKLKYVFYGAAGAATITTAYLRHIAGKHFPTDILLGTAIGTASGILVPRLHRNVNIGGNALRISPRIGNGYGFSAVYQF